MLSGVFSCHHISQQLLLLYNKVQISSLLLSQLVCHSGKGNCPLRHKIIWKLLVSGKTPKRNFFRLKPFIKRVYNLYTYICPLPVYLLTRVRDNIQKSKEQKNIQPTKGGHKMVTCQNYVSLFYCQITSCPSDGGIS